VLNGSGSAKEVRHVEFSLEGSGLVYEAGDALGVMPQNCPELVADVLAALGFDGEEAVSISGSTTAPLRLALTSTFDLGRPTPELVSAFATRSSAGGGTAVAVTPLHVIDVLHAHPGVKFTPTEFVALLKKLQPRLYSISSSPKAHPGQVHLTVGTVRYEANGQGRLLHLSRRPRGPR
jgi:sulfite reductase (NADPH) flavoprotein alpha-component